MSQTDLKVTNNGSIFRDIPTLETERLILRKLSMRDVNDIFEYASVPEIAKYVMWEHHRSIADSLHDLARHCDHLRARHPNWHPNAPSHTGPRSPWGRPRRR